jgi:hypothetical protein
MSAAAVTAVRPGVAHRVAASEAPGDAGDAGDPLAGPAEHGGEARHEPRRDQRHGDEQEERAGREQRQAALRIDAGAEHAEPEHRECEHDGDRREQRRTGGRCALAGCPLPRASP